MKCFYAGTFMNKDELNEIGTNYPIKLEYYKIQSENEANISKVFYGIEIIKTEYAEEVKIESIELCNITQSEKQLKEVLNLMKNNKVTPVAAQYIIDDYFYNKC